MGTRRAAIFSMVSTRGGHPTGTIALATALRMTETASPRRKICTECPASESAKPWRKGKAAFVGSSEPQALFIMMLSFLGEGCWDAAVTANAGRARRLERNDRRMRDPP